MTPRKILASVKTTRRSRQMRDRPPSSKDLDLLVLAGCSCLLTLLYHPVAEALQTAEIVNRPISRPSLQVSAQFNRTTFISAPIHTTLPPKREEIVEEEDEA